MSDRNKTLPIIIGLVLVIGFAAYQLFIGSEGDLLDGGFYTATETGESGSSESTIPDETYSHSQQDQKSLTPDSSNLNELAQNQPLALSEPKTHSPPMARRGGAKNSSMKYNTRTTSKFNARTTSSTKRSVKPRGRVDKDGRGEFAPRVAMLTPPNLSKKGKTPSKKAQKPKDIITKAKASDGSCYTVSFTHQRMRSHNDGEACTHHKNLLKLPIEKGIKLARKSICVRVNGKPVRHRYSKKRPGQILIGAVAGPQATVTARFCTGRVTCNEDCSIPKDEFMEALGGMNDDLLDSGAVVQWDPESKGDPSNVEKELDRELASLKKELADVPEDKTNVFRGWIKGKTKRACSQNKIRISNNQSGEADPNS